MATDPWGEAAAATAGGESRQTMSPGTWTRQRRRTSSIVVLVVAFLLLAGAVAVYYFNPETANTMLIAALALILVLGIFEAVVLWMPARAAAGAAGTAQETWGPAAAPGATLEIECPSCANHFSVSDPGTRPLEVLCPRCGTEGVIEEPPVAPAAVETPPALAALPPRTIRQMKLRCSGCRNEFTVDDTGERPLRMQCPSCGKRGVLKS